MIKNKKVILIILIILVIIIVAILIPKNDRLKGFVDGKSEISFILNNEKEMDEDIRERCPYRDGVSYRQCLFDFLDQTNKDLDASYSNLVKDVKVVMEEQLQRNGENNNTPREDFLKTLDDYNKKWKPYTESLCELDASIFWGGTGQGEIIIICKIKEAGAYSSWLERLTDDWVMPMIEEDIIDKVTPKTEAYRLLMRE